ncbi:MAG TPA: IPT/TIG domain-containing protein [Thermoanaerobaculia bacterium]|nr:IPT/TIG domain-containing protein [Thermoanaerobaculia bacterium]
MKSLRSLFLPLLLLAVPTALFAQNPPAPVIRSIEPSSGPSAGGTVVTITGDNLSVPPNFACFAPCPTLVKFGEVTVTPRNESNTQVVVVTPPNTPGAVDVKVTTGDGRSTTAANAFVYVQSAETSYERVLLPIYLDAPVAGGQGSLWKTDLWLRNHGKETVAIAPWPCPADGVCPAVFPFTKSLGPGEALHNLNPFFRLPPAIPGRFLYLSRNGAKDVDINLRTLDASRDASNAGTEVPVVREGDLRTSTLHLINIPIDPRFRQTLRIYDTAQSPTRYAVRVYDFVEGKTGALLASATVDVSTPETGEFRDLPPYGQIADLSALFVTNGSRSAVRVEVEPQTPGSLFWAFVSVTNNDTQHVTLVTPQ